MSWGISTQDALVLVSQLLWWPLAAQGGMLITDAPHQLDADEWPGNQNLGV